MILQPRVPLTQNVLCRHDESTGVAEQGAVCYLSGDKKVAKITASGQVPFGLLGQRVKGNMAGLPQNFEFPGEIGNSDARLGDPVLVYHGGIFETTYYIVSGSVTAGDPLYGCIVGASDQGKLCKDVLLAGAGAVAIALNSLTADETSALKPLLIKLAL